MRLPKFLRSGKNPGFKLFLFKSLIAGSAFAFFYFTAYLLEKPIELYEAFYNPAFNIVLALAIAFFVFAFLCKERISEIGRRNINWLHQGIFFLGFIALFAIRFSFELGPAKKLLTFASLVFILLAVYGLPSVKWLLKNFWRQGIISLIVFLGVEHALNNNLLLYASTHAAFYLLSLAFPGAALDLSTQWPTVTVGNFTTYISSFCSGIEAMTLFSGFFLLMIVLRFEGLHRSKFLAFYFLGLGGAYALTILRIFILLAAGALVDSKFAVDLFHSYASLILFLNYFALFWLFSRDFLSEG